MTSLMTIDMTYQTYILAQVKLQTNTDPASELQLINRRLVIGRNCTALIHELWRDKQKIKNKTDIVLPSKFRSAIACSERKMSWVNMSRVTC